MGMRRLSRWFVLWSTLVWAAAEGGRFVLAGFWLLSLYEGYGVAAVAGLGWAPSAAARVLAGGAGVALIGLLLFPMRERVRLARWIAYSLAGVVMGTVVIDLLPFPPTDSLSLSLAYSCLIHGAFGLTLGVVQGQAFQRPSDGWALRWGMITAGAWGLYSAAYELTLPVLPLLSLSSFFIPGLVTGLALKRIVEAQPAPSEDVGAPPEVPSTSGPVQ